jgi:hypothetical protein
MRPDAVVLDRHQARLAEKPNAGVYADVEKGVVKGAAYGSLKQQFLLAAKRAGRDPRDYSADVWTGIRETIKNTDQLYGQPFKGSSIVGDSKSYADIFSDVIRDKANHMKITVQELEKRLKAGDANLLSALLSAPGAYGAYQAMQVDQSQTSAPQ